MAEGTKPELPENFYDMSTVEKTKFLAETYLDQIGAKSEDNSVSGPDILRNANKQYPDHGVKDNTFFVNLSLLVRRSDSKLNSAGTRKGFYLSEAVAKLEQLSENTAKETAEPTESKKRIERERLLYPVFLEWLFVQGYTQADNTADLRNQDLGTWSNPDLTAIRVYDVLGTTGSIEIATIEVKLTIDNWKYNIFEAVSHKRLANRVYFAFAHPQETITKIDPDLKAYAELYGIGILVLPLETETFEHLVSGKVRSELENVASTDIVEYFSAPDSGVSYPFRGRFLKAIGIEKERELHKWGTQIE